MISMFSQFRLFHRPYLFHLQQVLLPYQITETQWALLRRLHEEGPATFSDIALYWGVEKPSITPIAQKLIEQKWIYIVAGEDKRQKLMHLTGEGITKFNELQPVVEKFQQELLVDITDEERKIVEKVFDRLQVNISKRG